MSRGSSPPKELGSDYDVLNERLLNVIKRRNPDELKRFSDCPVIVADKQLRDAINERVIGQRADKMKQPVHRYLCKDRRNRKLLPEESQKGTRGLNSTITDTLGSLPLFIGMCIRITENTDMSHVIVNGSEGIVKHIKYSTGSREERYAECVYVYIDGVDSNAPAPTK